MALCASRTVLFAVDVVPAHACHACAGWSTAAGICRSCPMCVWGPPSCSLNSPVFEWRNSLSLLAVTAWAALLSQRVCVSANTPACVTSLYADTATCRALHLTQPLLWVTLDAHCTFTVWFCRMHPARVGCHASTYAFSDTAVLRARLCVYIL